MATYKEIQSFVKRRYGFNPKTCWIAHVKEEMGLPLKKAPNRQREQRKYPCPEEKKSAIEEALRNFGMIERG